MNCLANILRVSTSNLIMLFVFERQIYPSEQKERLEYNCPSKNVNRTKECKFIGYQRYVDFIQGKLKICDIRGVANGLNK